MSAETSPRRMPLRQLMTSCDKVTKQLQEVLQKEFLPRVSESRDVTRPVRRRSHYPTMAALQDNLLHLEEAAEHLNAVASSLLEHLDALRDLGQRERLNRRL